jgi:hypothetical protein
MQEESDQHAHVAAVAATLLAHQQAKHAAEQIGRADGNSRASNWKQAARRF